MISFGKQMISNFSKVVQIAMWKINQVIFKQFNTFWSKLANWNWIETYQ